MALISVDLPECLFELQSAALEFDLNQRQAVDQKRDIVAIGIGAGHGGLIGHLVLVLAPVNLVDQLDVADLARVFPVIDFVAQCLGFVEDVSACELFQDLVELIFRKRGLVVFFELSFQILNSNL